MNPTNVAPHLRIASLHRYPVKSMLGETVSSLFVDDTGAHGDRQFALIDVATGRVASAKQARLWRGLLQCTARLDSTGARIALPDGSYVRTADADVDEQLSMMAQRAVHLADRRPPGASLERADPEQALNSGLDAEVDAPLLELGQATPGDSFTDYAPLHAVTRATLQHIGTEALRYRPNIVIETPPGFPPYAENEWTGRTLAIGTVRLRVLGPTPRCVVPTLEHGKLPRANHALRTPTAQNRVSAFDFGVLPCVGSYLGVTNPGPIGAGQLLTVK
jgi:uncharacterized protein YcbX